MRVENRLINHGLILMAVGTSVVLEHPASGILVGLIGAGLMANAGAELYRQTLTNVTGRIGREKINDIASSSRIIE